MSQLTTHVLDTSRGRPASNLSIYLFRQRENHWDQMTMASTNEDGRVPNLLAADVLLDAGIYKLRFETGEYYSRYEIECFYPYAEIVFSIQDHEHYHVPLLLSPFGYSTYRGS